MIKMPTHHKVSTVYLNMYAQQDTYNKMIYNLMEAYQTSIPIKHNTIARKWIYKYV